MIGNGDGLEKRLAGYREELNDLYAELDILIKANAIKPQDQSDYKQKYDALDGQIELKKVAIREIEDQISDAKTRKGNARIFLEALRNTPSNCKITKFDVTLWHALVEYATITRDRTIIYHFRNGKEETVTIKLVRKQRVLHKKPSDD